MPKAVTDEHEQDYGVAIARDAVQTTRPLIEGAKVVYLGANRHKSVPLKGRIAVETFGDDQVRSVVDAGFTCYDFSTHDARGQVIVSRQMAATHPVPQVRGKPFAECEHPDHLWDLSRRRTADGQPEFEIIVPKAQKRAIEEYFYTKQRTQKRERTDFAEITRVAG